MDLACHHFPITSFARRFPRTYVRNWAVRYLNREGDSGAPQKAAHMVWEAVSQQQPEHLPENG